MDVTAFLNQSLKFKGVIKGVYTVMKPDASRMTVLLFARDFKTYCLYIRQHDLETIEMEVRADEPNVSLPPKP